MKKKPSKRKLKVVTPREVKLDLACGQNVREGFRGVDLYAPEAERVDLLKFPWPWEDNSVDELHCSHFVEHIPAREVSGETDFRDEVKLGFDWVVERQGQDMLFAFFDEAWRILKPGATMTVIVPDVKSERAFQDPTHRRFIPRWMFAYLSATWRKEQKLDHYRVRCNFDVAVVHTCAQEETLRAAEVQQKRFSELWNVVLDLHATLKAVKT